jgi:hypothetical protein
LSTLQKALVGLKHVLNVGKTKYMLVCSSRKNVSESLYIYPIDCSPIDQVPAYKYMCIWIDKDLIVFKHMDELLKKSYNLKWASFLEIDLATP